MKRTLEKGHTLLVDGPVCVNLLAGEVEAFGAILETRTKTVIRKGKRVAFEVKENAHFDLVLGEDASVEEFEGSTIPDSWKKACNTTLAFGEKPVIVVVMGEVDSGKTSFCTYLANRALREKRSVAIIDADLGQSDIGPPSTIGFSRLASPISDISLLTAETVYFIGSTTPAGVSNEVIDKLAKLKDESPTKAMDFLVVNTDGWVLGEEAVQYKLRLVERVSPVAVVGIQQQDELAPILVALEGIRVISIESPLAIKKRSRERRKILRELSYKKYLEGAKVRSFPLDWVKIEGISVGAGITPSEAKLEKIRAKLESTPIYCEETPNMIVFVLGRNQWIDEKRIPNLEEELGKKAMLIREGDEEDLLAGLHDDEGRFLGISVLCKIDYVRHTAQVYTPVSANIASIHVGQVKLDRQGKEIGVNPVL